MIHHEMHLRTHQSKFVTKLMGTLKNSLQANHIVKIGIKQKDSDNSFKIRVPAQTVLRATHRLILTM